jgi:hypothetical protein
MRRPSYHGNEGVLQVVAEEGAEAKADRIQLRNYHQGMLHEANLEEVDAVVGCRGNYQILCRFWSLLVIMQTSQLYKQQYATKGLCRHSKAMHMWRMSSRQWLPQLQQQMSGSTRLLQAPQESGSQVTMIVEGRTYCRMMGYFQSWSPTLPTIATRNLRKSRRILWDTSVTMAMSRQRTQSPGKTSTTIEIGTVSLGSCCLDTNL